MPSFVVLGFVGFEVMAFSYTFVSPSPSESALGSEESNVSVLFGEATAVELPDEFVATAVNEPTALAARVSVMVAEVPPEPMFTLEMVIAAGLKVGRNANVAAVRLEPVT